MQPTTNISGGWGFWFGFAVFLSALVVGLVAFFNHRRTVSANHEVTKAVQAARNAINEQKMERGRRISGKSSRDQEWDRSERSRAPLGRS